MKICVIGEKESVLAFKGLGLEVFSYTNPNKIKKIIKELVDKGYTIFLITEREAEAVADFCDSFSDEAYPIFLPIPNGVGRSGYGLGKVKQSIARAAGG